MLRLWFTLFAVLTGASLIAILGTLRIGFECRGEPLGARVTRTDKKLLSCFHVSQIKPQL